MAQWSTLHCNNNAEQELLKKNMWCLGLSKKGEWIVLTLIGGQDPDNFATVINSLKIEYGNEFDKESNSVALISTVGSEYRTTVISKWKLLKSKDAAVTSDTLVVTMCTCWRVSRAEKRKSPGGANETLLVDASYLRNFDKTT
jgi:hypothetical protein